MIKLNLLKYKYAIIIFISFAIINILIFFLRDISFPMVIYQDLSFFIPFSGAIEINILFLLILPIMAIIGGVIGTYLAPLLILIHKLVFGKKVSYGFEEIKKPDKFKSIFKGFFPSLMAINFAILISDIQFIQDLLLSDSISGLGLGFLQIVTFLLCVSITLIPSFSIFSGLWTLSDAGIVFSNKKQIEVRGKAIPHTVQSLGNWIKYLLKGYAGIAVIFAYYELVFLFLVNIGSSTSQIYLLIVNFYLFLGYILILPIVTIPVVIILDIMMDWRIRFIKKFANKLGIKDNVEVNFTIIS